jgi:hypothetical protein
MSLPPDAHPNRCARRGNTAPAAASTPIPDSRT